MKKISDTTLFDALIEREFKELQLQIDAKRIVTTAKNKPRALDKTIREILTGSKEEMSNGKSDCEEETDSGK